MLEKLKHLVMGKSKKVSSDVNLECSFLKKELEILYALDSIRDKVKTVEELALHVQEKILSFIPSEFATIFSQL